MKFVFVQNWWDFCNLSGIGVKIYNEIRIIQCWCPDFLKVEWLWFDQLIWRILWFWFQFHSPFIQYVWWPMFSWQRWHQVCSSDHSIPWKYSFLFYKNPLHFSLYPLQIKSGGIDCWEILQWEGLTMTIDFSWLVLVVLN